MSRKRWVYIEGEAVPVGDDYTPEPRTVRDSILWNDRQYQDCGDPRFSSRTTHQQYMRQKGVTHTSDFSNEWRVKEKQRIDARNGVDRTRRQDIEKTVHQLISRRQP